MIEAVVHDARSTGRSTGRPELAPRVLEALEAVPRHEFVPPELEGHAYENRALPIGEGQTISQPFIVALMTDLLDPEPTDRILEIGTGSGYQAAVLAHLVGVVRTIEIVRPLGQRAAALLERLGLDNVHVRIGDGWKGWPEKGPYDGIVITAAIAEIPPPLLDQLAVGGSLVVPRGHPGGHQELVVVRRGENGRLETREVLPVRFVPFTGSHGRDERGPSR